MEPFVLLAFFLCFVVIFGRFEANTCHEAKCDLVGSPLFLGISAVSGGFGSQNRHFSLWTPKWPFLHSKNTTFQLYAKNTLQLGKTPKGYGSIFLSSNRPNLTKACYRTGQKTPKGQMVPFSRMYRGATPKTNRDMLYLPGFGDLQPYET